MVDRYVEDASAFVRYVDPRLFIWVCNVLVETERAAVETEIEFTCDWVAAVETPNARTDVVMVPVDVSSPFICD